MAPARPPFTPLSLTGVGAACSATRRCRNAYFRSGTEYQSKHGSEIRLTCRRGQPPQISNTSKRLLGWPLPMGIGSKVRLFVTTAVVFLLHFNVRLKDKSEGLQGKELCALSCERAAIQSSTEERISCSDCSYFIMI